MLRPSGGRSSMPEDLGPEEPGPDEVRLGGQQGGSSLRRPRRHARSPHAASRHVTSLRRSQQRLIGEEPTTVAADEVSPTPAAPNLSDYVDATRSTRARLRASLLYPGRGQILAAIILFIVGAAGVMQFRINA